MAEACSTVVSSQKDENRLDEIQSRVERIRRIATERHFEGFDSLVESDFIDNSWSR